MTKALAGADAAKSIAGQFPDAVVSSTDDSVLVKREALLDVAGFLNKTAGLEFDYLLLLSGVDYLDYFEVVYHLVSMKNNQSLVLKTRCHDRANASVPSVTSVWYGASFQERETYDLMGIRFENHPDLRRIYLWDGFQGHPLRRDYL